MVTDNLLAAKEYEMYSISAILKSSVYFKKETQSITTIYLSIKKNADVGLASAYTGYATGSGSRLNASNPLGSSMYRNLVGS